MGCCGGRGDYINEAEEKARPDYNLNVSKRCSYNQGELKERINKLRNEIVPGAGLTKEEVSKILKLIVDHRIHYKEDKKEIEQDIRLEYIKDGKRNDYALQVLSDCKKKVKRSTESKHIILMKLNIQQYLYDDSLKEIGDERELEEEVYRDCLREFAKTPEGKKLLDKSQELINAYTLQLNTAGSRFGLNDGYKEKLSKNIPDNKILKCAPRMIALDYIYNDYKLNDFAIDLLIENEEGNL